MHWSAPSIVANKQTEPGPSAPPPQRKMKIHYTLNRTPRHREEERRESGRGNADEGEPVEGPLIVRAGGEFGHEGKRPGGGHEDVGHRHVMIPRATHLPMTCQVSITWQRSRGRSAITTDGSLMSAAREGSPAITVASMAIQLAS